MSIAIELVTVFAAIVGAFFTAYPFLHKLAKMHHERDIEIQAQVIQTAMFEQQKHDETKERVSRLESDFRIVEQWRESNEHKMNNIAAQLGAQIEDINEKIDKKMDKVSDEIKGLYKLIVDNNNARKN